MKERLDVLLVKQGFAESREKAKAVIMSGNVYVNDQKEDKAGSMFDEAKARIEVRGNPLKYVSRGGLKLEKAIEQFGVALSGKICMDIGASTGGFTDCMLQNGAEKVYAIDVGYIRLPWDTDNWRGSLETMRVSSAWKRRISATYSLRILRIRLILHRWTCRLSHLTKYWDRHISSWRLTVKWYA